MRILYRREDTLHPRPKGRGSMIGWIRLIVFLGLGVTAVVQHQFIIAILCFATPWVGPIGMYTAVFAAVLFLGQNLYIEAVIAFGVILVNLFGNRVITKK